MESKKETKTYKTFYCEEEKLKETILKDGVAVIKDVLTEEEIKIAREELWNMLEYITQNFETPFKANDKKTWRSYYKLFPKHGMLLQHWKVGQSQFVWNIRQNPKIVKIFSKLWGVDMDKLLVSFDGLSCHLSPEITNKGYYRGNDWLHVDQSFTNKKFCCVQGMITLWDCNEGDATLCFRLGSNTAHKDFGEKFKITDKSNWYKFCDKKQIDYLKQFPIYCVKATKGSMIFWDSRTVHCGTESRRGREKDNIRCVVYLCYLPRNTATEKVLEKKRKAFKEQRMTSHWANKVSLFGKLPRTYGGELPNVKELPMAKLNYLGYSLAGF